MDLSEVPIVVQEAAPVASAMDDFDMLDAGLDDIDTQHVNTSDEARKK